MTWTPERIEAVRALLDGTADARTMWSSGPIQIDRNALARIGLAVVEASPETVERVFSVMAWGSPERPLELAHDEQMARAMAGNPDLVSRVRAVLAVISGGA